MTEIRPEDLQIGVYSIGSGHPQHVRIIHLPTGIVTQAEHPSALEAKETALAELHARLERQAAAGTRHDDEGAQACEHDWRVDPRTILTSMPPQERLVCAICGANSSRTAPGPAPPSWDPKDWEKAARS